MTRVLVVLPDGTPDPNHSGGASRYAQNITALCRLSEETRVVRLSEAAPLLELRAHEAASPYSRQIRQRVASWEDIVYVPESQVSGKLNVLRRSLSDPVRFRFPSRLEITRIIVERAQFHKPELVWLEGAYVAVAARALNIPTLFSHTDFMYRVLAIRLKQADWRQRHLLWAWRRAERQVALMADWVLTGSTSDARRLQEIGCRNVVTIPPTYEPRPGPAADAEPTVEEMRVVHLGSLETTANLVGLTAYMRDAHDKAVELCREAGVPLTLWAIGANDRLKPPLSVLLQRENIRLPGFAPDLDAVLRPFDVAILPYEHDTGYRTKLPVLLSHAQAVVATRAAVAGTLLPGLAEVCIMVDEVAQFPAVLAWLAANPAERVRLGRAGHAFFCRYFTHDAVMPLYRQLLDEVTKQ